MTESSSSKKNYRIYSFSFFLAISAMLLASCLNMVFKLSLEMPSPKFLASLPTSIPFRTAGLDFIASNHLRTFSNKSYGFNTGKKIGYNLYFPKVGAVKMGPQRFSSSKDIDKIFKNNYKILKKEIISRTIHNRKDLISEWIVEATKNNV